MNKNVLFLLLCLIAMLSVSAVSAIDYNITEDNLNASDDYISVLDNDEIENNLEDNIASSKEVYCNNNHDLNFKNREYNVNVTTNNQVLKISSDDNQNYEDSSEDNNITIEISDVNMFYHDGTRFIAVLTDYQGNPIANATVYFTINGVTYTRTTDYGGTASMALNLNSGVYDAAVKYNNIIKNITVTIMSTIISQGIIKDYGDMPLFSATFLDRHGAPLVNTNVSFSINGIFYTRETNEYGVAKLSIILNPGNYILTAINPVNGEQRGYNVTVVGILPDIVVDVGEAIENKDININVTLPNDATGIVNLEVGGYKFKSSLIGGTAIFNIPGLSNGIYLLNIIYSGDKKYPSNNITKYLTVNVNENPSLYVNNVYKYYKGSDVLYAILKDYQNNPIANVNITFSINGNEYIRETNNDGLASMNINLKPGQYNVTTKYGVLSVNSIIDIHSTIVANNIIKMYQNDTQFYAKFVDSDGKALTNTKVQFNINGIFYTRETNGYGVAKLSINLRPGNYILTAINPVNGEESGYNVTVKSLVEANNLIKYYKNESKFQATIYNKDGSLAINKEVTFNINGVFYKRITDENGVANLGINLRPGHYIITTIIDGLEIGNRVTVLPTVLTNNLDMKFQDGSKFIATILNGQGIPLANQYVMFNVNGVFYNKITDDGGIARLNVNLIPGEYIITTMWDDYQVGNNITIY